MMGTVVKGSSFPLFTSDKLDVSDVIAKQKENINITEIRKEKLPRTLLRHMFQKNRRTNFRQNRCNPR